MKKIYLIFIGLVCCFSQLMSQDILNEVLSGNIQNVKTLLKDNPELINTKDGYGNTLLARSIYKENIEMAEVLLQHGSKLNDPSRRDIPINLAIGTQIMPLVKLFIDKGADINIKDGQGRTPLNFAVESKNKKIAYYLLDKGATLNKEIFTINDVRSALIGGMDRILTSLLAEISIDYSNKNSYGNSLLHAAAEGGAIYFAKELLRRNIDVNEKNHYGWAPIHFASQTGEIEMIEYLVSQGANKNILTTDGKTPYSIAEEYKQAKTQDFLRDNDFQTASIQFPKLESKYIDSSLPQNNPQLFTPGIISKTQTFEHFYISFTAAIDAVCWTDSQRGKASSIFLMEKINGLWEKPQLILQNASNPFIAPDGKRIYFKMKRELEDGEKAQDKDLFYMERTKKGWGKPLNLGPNINNEDNIGSYSLTKENTIYFISNEDVYRSRYINGKYAPKEKLPETINTEFIQDESFIAQDEDFLIYRSSTLGETGLPGAYISFREQDDTWSTPVNLSKKLYLPGLFPCLTPDNKYLFYFDHDFYWQDAGIIEAIRKNRNSDILYISDALLNTISEKGVKSAIKLYWNLKKKAPNFYIFNEDMLNYLGYNLLSQDLINEAIEIFKLNTKVYPESGNAYDSLGEAYMKNGDNDMAIQNYTKSLELDPRNNNAKEMLIELNK